MYPGFFHWWKEAQRQATQHGAYAHCGPADCGPRGQQQQRQRRQRGPEDHEASGGDDGGGSFGVRRPLRFMAWKLELNEEQVDKMAAILADLKTERAQAAVDYQRSVGSFADVLAPEAFDKDAAKTAANTRVLTAEKLRDAVVKALEKTHALLTPDQRKQLAYLLRSGQLTI
ncbi:MAG: Spy/CpxP family protein refolding chaperone [Deltaproteobacteria bacterium]|nr:Spy/CpxP family protein refolding chaperone [Deltaproteobacteria bacterium]